MAIKSFRSREFRRCLEALSEEIQTLAHEKFVLWKKDPGHPSLHFKKLRVWASITALSGIS